MGRRIAAALVVLLCAACAGCGLGPGAGTSQVSLRVTEGFGARAVKTVTIGKVSGAETVMGLLQGHFSVATKYGGGFVESIGGRSASATGRRDWFYYVNGVQAPKGAAMTAVHEGDDIWWDLHDWAATDSIPAIVGSFPEPFARGIGGRRYPTTLECSQREPRACTTVSDEMGHLHIPASSQLLGTGSGPDTLSINVGTWDEVRFQVAGELIDHGPGAGGVYVRFSKDGHSLSLLDAAGHVTRTFGAGTGLIAATADETDVPTWFVTGTDPAGVLAASKALTPSALADHFALVVSGGHDYPVPDG